MVGGGGDFSSLHNLHQWGPARACVEVLSRPRQGATQFVPANMHSLEKLHQYCVYSLSSLHMAGSPVSL